MRVPVLVVEDDRDERLALASWLRLRGFRVELASNGREALEILSRAKTLPSLIFLDLEMPDVDGWRLLASIALEPAWRELPVIVTSGLVDGPARLELPTVAFVPKPLHPETLEPLIESLLCGGSTEIPSPVSDDEPTAPHGTDGWRSADAHPTDRMQPLAPPWPRGDGA